MNSRSSIGNRVNDVWAVFFALLLGRGKRVLLPPMLERKLWTANNSRSKDVACNSWAKGRCDLFCLCRALLLLFTRWKVKRERLELDISKLLRLRTAGEYNGERKWAPNFCRWALPYMQKRHKVKKNKRELSRILSLVAGEGIEPPAFGLWAQRATTAPPRDAVFKTDAKV